MIAERPLALYIDNERIALKEFTVLGRKRNMHFLHLDLSFSALLPAKAKRVFVQNGVYRYQFSALSRGFLIIEGDGVFRAKKIGEHSFVAVVDKKGDVVFGQKKDGDTVKLSPVYSYKSLTFYDCPHPVLRVGNGIFQMQKEEFPVQGSLGESTMDATLFGAALPAITLPSVLLGEHSLGKVSLSATLPSTSFRSIR